MILTQRSLAGGEIAPALYSRVDTVKYSTAARVMRNFSVMKSGGVQNRPGSLFVGEAHDSSKRTRIIPFIFNSDQTYILELSDEKMRFIKNGAYVMSTTTRTVSTFSAASPAAIITTANHGWNEGDTVVITGLVTNARINGRPMRMQNITLNSFDLYYLNGVPYFSLGSEAVGSIERVYAIDFPYTEDEIFDVYYAQNADIMIFAHPSYPVKELNRLADDNWTVNDLDIRPTIDPPLNPTVSGTNGSADNWVVTAVAAETYEESTPSNVVGANSVASSGSPRTIGWDPVSGATEYNIYKAKNGIYGYIGTAIGVTFVDNGITPDTLSTPPIVRDPFPSTDNYPAVVSYIQQRLALGNTNNNTEGVWTSRSALYKNFSVRSPIQADDAVTFSMVGRQVNAVRHILELEKPVILTQGGEHWIGGDVSGILRPDAVNPTQFGYNGANKLIPIIIGGNALFVQNLGSVVRDIGVRMQQDGYNGNDLTTFSTHLFKNKTIVDWAYQQTPHSLVWAARSDGKLLCLTYVPEQQIFGWSRHEFASLGTFGTGIDTAAGIVESVAVVPENGKHATYLVIKRTNLSINPFGSSPEVGAKRYIERLSDRDFEDVTLDAIFIDSVLTYDGRNSDPTHTMTVPMGDFTADEDFTLTSSNAFFVAGDVGNEIHLTDTLGLSYRLQIKQYTSPTQVVVFCKNSSIGSPLGPLIYTVWAKAVDAVGGLFHLNGSRVSVFADGFVIANPLNSETYPSLLVQDDQIELDQCFKVIHVGLPYISDLETLDIDTANGESIVDKKKLPTAVTIYVEETRGLWVGENPGDDTLTDLVEIKMRDEENYDDPVALHTGTMHQNLLSEWNSNGRILIRQIDPLPATILGVAPAGMFPFRG